MSLMHTLHNLRFLLLDCWAVNIPVLRQSRRYGGSLHEAMGVFGKAAVPLLEASAGFYAEWFGVV